MPTASTADSSDPSKPFVALPGVTSAASPVPSAEATTGQKRLREESDDGESISYAVIIRIGAN